MFHFLGVAKIIVTSVITGNISTELKAKGDVYVQLEQKYEDCKTKYSQIGEFINNNVTVTI